MYCVLLSRRTDFVPSLFVTTSREFCVTEATAPTIRGAFASAEAPSTPITKPTNAILRVHMASLLLHIVRFPLHIKLSPVHISHLPHQQTEPHPPNHDEPHTTKKSPSTLARL